MNVATQVPAMFGANLKFAPQSPEEDKAFELLSHCRHSRVGWAVVENEIRRFLLLKGVARHDVEAEVAAARECIQPWLLD